MLRRTKIILAVTGMAIVWPFAQIGLIAAQAQYFADGRPYCIEVSSDRILYYRPVASLLELNGSRYLRLSLVQTAPVARFSGPSTLCSQSIQERPPNAAIGRIGISTLIG